MDQTRVLAQQSNLAEEVQRLRKEITLERINNRDLVKRRQRPEAERRVTILNDPAPLPAPCQTAPLRSCFTDRKRHAVASARYAPTTEPLENSLSINPSPQPDMDLSETTDSGMGVSVRDAPQAVYMLPSPAGHPNSLMPTPSPLGNGKVRKTIFSPVQSDYKMPEPTVPHKLTKSMSGSLSRPLSPHPEKRPCLAERRGQLGCMVSTEERQGLMYLPRGHASASPAEAGETLCQNGQASLPPLPNLPVARMSTVMLPHSP